jgi:uncharacterized protein
MAIQVSYPGVYIDEFTPAAPIQGVGTSTAAFIGVNAKAPPYQPILITSWDAFVEKFSDGAAPEDDDFLWYAVRGFFLNGGKVCFVTAVSSARADSGSLNDEVTPTTARKPTLRFEARSRGQTSPPISVAAVAASAVPASAQPAKLFEPTATIATTSADKLSVDLTDTVAAANFLGGDKLLLGSGATSDEPTVARVSGSLIFFTAPLTNSYTNKALRLADLVPFSTSFRAENAQGLVAGSILSLAQNGATTQTTFVKSVAVERISATVTTYRVTVKDGIDGFTLYKPGNKPITLQSQEFTLTVSGQAQPYAFLSMNPEHPRYYANVINNDSSGTIVAHPADPPNTAALPANRPGGTVVLGGGARHDAAAIRSAPLLYYTPALQAIERIADVNLVVVPDSTDLSVQDAVKTHCANLADRFAILDATQGTQLADIETQRNGLENDKGFAALYYPWIEVASQKTGRRIPVPPSGHVAGIYARTDNSRGVHKAPAGAEATLNGALGVEKMFSDADQGFINLKGINVIRVFQHGGVPVVWGARTTSKNTNWQYVNIRRLFIYLEESIQQGIRGSVFEPNNTSLWQKLKRTIGAFLTQQWRDGALFGKTVEEAFYVRIDEVLNPDNERALGRLTIEIGVRPSYPAEFIVVRIGIWQGGSSVSES